MKRHILILGGTTEARQLAQLLAPRADISATLSLAGRTASPLAQPVPTRRGGFGGISGLARYLRDEAVYAVIDATHPYAAVISAHAAAAARQTNTPLIALRRAPWRAVAGDRWSDVLDASEAVRVLGATPRRVFLALGRQEIAPFASAPQHHYLIRSVDPVEPPLAVPHAQYIEARGPFGEEEEGALLTRHAVEAMVAKNSGGQATYGKIAAARTLGIPVLLIRRPADPKGRSVAGVHEAIAWLDHALGADAHVLGAELDRGV
jgi:precorrin-6A/cobalt-precorrin-6A reductase